jgi:predicted N-acyltransferase
MRSGIHSRIDALEPRQWNALAGTHIPFLRHEFLSALEHTGCIGAHTGWEPRYFTLHDAQGLAPRCPPS